MGRTNQCSIQEDEILAEEVKQYPCLYDKSNSQYKDAIRKKNAWAKIEENRKRPSGSSSHDWEVLLSRYSRKRMKKLGGISFSPMVHLVYSSKKKTKTNVMEPDGPQQFEESTVRLNLEDEGGVESERGTTLNSSPPELDEGSPESVQKQPNASRSKRFVQNNVLNKISAFLNFKRNKPMSTNTADDLFGKMIADELKQIPEKKEHCQTRNYRHNIPTSRQHNCKNFSGKSTTKHTIIRSGSRIFSTASKHCNTNKRS